MKKKVLVIGANGFTGRRILNDLSRNDEYIVTGCSPIWQMSALMKR